MLREFRVGFSPRVVGPRDRRLARRGLLGSEILAAGLASRRREGPGLLDRFRGRIMFPLADPKGHVLGFGARALAPDDQPKYLNTSDSELFHKGSLVYGADLARARGRALRAARARRGLHRRDRAAPGRDPRDGLLDGYGADRAPARRAQAADAQGAALPGPGCRGAGGGREGQGRDPGLQRGPPPARLRPARGAAPAGAGPGRRRPARGRGGDAGAARDVGAGGALRGRAGARRRLARHAGGPRRGPARGRAGRRPARAGAAAVRPDPADRQPAADAGVDDERGAAQGAAQQRPRAPRRRRRPRAR